MSELLYWLVAVALYYIFTGSLVNLWTWPKLKNPNAELDYQSTDAQNPRISILIPARNEAEQIELSIRHLLAQTYETFELYLLDDQSMDGTADIALAAANNDPRFTLMHGTPLPAGWLGKNWACHQLSEAATGDILIFTDADVRWQPDALAAIVAELAAHPVDAMSVWPTQITLTWAERLIVPLMAFSIIGYTPTWLFNRVNWPGTAVATGQCLLFLRTAYQTIGGHAAARSAIIEDVALAHRVKRARLWMRNVDGASMLTCRMYRGWNEVMAGFGKNILAGHANSTIFLLFSTAFHWSLFVLPWIWLLWAWRTPFEPLLFIATGIGTRAITAFATGQRIRDALLLPISVLLMTRIAIQALYWTRFGKGLRWKGRTVG